MRESFCEITSLPSARNGQIRNHLVSHEENKNCFGNIIKFLLFYFLRYQDVYSQVYIMVKASARWLGVHMDLLSAILIGTVAVAAALVSQDAGT